MSPVIPLLPHVIYASLKQHFDEYLVHVAESITGNKLQSKRPVWIDPTATESASESIPDSIDYKRVPRNSLWKPHTLAPDHFVSPYQDLTHVLLDEKYRIPPDPRQDTGLWVPAMKHPGSPLQNTPGPVPGTAPSSWEKKNFR
ncbi:hypothetical protein F2Q68_00039720 [Brassica cretica]|uniref:Uncharacterized protein n=1 Tax=Brassica cretica TaxID=69181 RepID=A0A8S9MHI8_BRACR|nr:hypothetical protein F2Q68_00039720 [Brassica cretica]